MSMPETGEVVPREDIARGHEIGKGHLVGLCWKMVVRPNKLSLATTYGIPVASERRFLEWIRKAVPDNVHKTYSCRFGFDVAGRGPEQVPEIERRRRIFAFVCKHGWGSNWRRSAAHA